MSPTPTETTAGPACPDVQIIGLRGVGESLDTFDGLGPEVHGVAEVLTKRLDDADVGTVRTTALRYPNELSNDVEYLAQQAINGQKRLSSSLRTFVAKCPDSQLVLLGYSMGAQISHQTMSAEPELAGRIAALALIADPGRDPDGPIKTVSLDGRPLPNGGPIPSGPIGALAERAISACATGDTVCAQGSIGPADTHATAYQTPQAAQKIADALIAVVTGS